MAVAVAALAIAYATPSQAGYGGYYLVTFKYPGGTFAHCFSMQETDEVAGYKVSGNWINTDYPGVAEEVVERHCMAGYIPGQDETDYLAIDGQVSSDTIINATFDYFTPNGLYIAAGSLTEERDPQCRSPD